MLDEEKLSTKLAILQKWMEGMARGEHEMTPKGARTFAHLLTQCEHEAMILEAPARIAGLTEEAARHLDRARTHINAANAVIAGANVLAMVEPGRAAR